MTKLSTMEKRGIALVSLGIGHAAAKEFAMAVDASQIVEGMEAYSSDNKKLGTVIGIHDSDGDAPHVVIEHKGLLGRTAEHLYIPLTQIESCLPEGRLTVFCTKEAAQEHFGHQVHA